MGKAQKVVAVLLVIAGIIHLLPVSGVLGVERLAVLYGVSLHDPDLEILMRHRAILLGLLGFLMIHAAFRSAQQGLVIILGLVSVISFIVIAWLVGGYNESISQVVIADVVALVALIVAGAIRAATRKYR
ncbi:MAG: hypothetical protein Tsb002_38560 [Wenzhouxiangellaceae bacterium]